MPVISETMHLLQKKSEKCGLMIPPKARKLIDDKSIPRILKHSESFGKLENPNHYFRNWTNYIGCTFLKDISQKVMEMYCFKTVIIILKQFIIIPFSMNI